MSGGSDGAIVLYDDDCGFCKWSLNKILVLDRARRLRPVSMQGPEGQSILDAHAVSDPLRSWHVVLPSGELRSAGAAGGAVARLLPAGRPAAWLMDRFPRVTERAYRLVAENRDRISRLIGIEATCEVKR